MLCPPGASQGASSCQGSPFVRTGTDLDTNLFEPLHVITVHSWMTKRLSVESAEIEIIPSEPEAIGPVDESQEFETSAIRPR